MANEVERGSTMWGCVCSLLSLVIFNDVCVGSDFMDGDIVVGAF